MWRPQLEHFGRERRAIAFDYPGYGDSDPAPEGTTRDDYAAAILSAMTRARASTARTSAACRSAAWSPSPCTTPARSAAPR